MASWLEAQIDKEKNRAEGKRLAFLQQLKAKRAGIGMQQIIPQPQYDLPQTPQWTPSPAIDVAQQPILMSQNVMTSPEVRTWQPRYTPQMPVSPTVERPMVTQPVAKPLEKKEPATPFWQRALEKFSAPFEWVDEYVIKPGLAVGATAIGAVEDVKRLPGEDYFEWKKRSWEGWEAPGFDIDVSWGDGDIRIDLKGVLEFAPWLLMPGAGAVGTGVRAGAGVAGMLGKAGKVGKVLGTAVEFSPWGIAEKAVGAAAKGVFKGAEKLSGRAGAKVFGAIPEKEVSPAVKEFTTLFKEKVLPRYEEFQAGKPLAASRREAISREVFAKQRRGEITGEQAIAEINKRLKGTGIKEDFAIPPWERKAIKPNVGALLDEIATATERGMVNLDTATALQSLLLKGELPEAHHIKDFARVFGNEFAKTVSQLKGVKKGKLDSVIDFLNIPRAVLASGDISGVARQGLILGLTHPTKTPRSFVRMMKSMFSEKLALQIDDTMRADPLFNEFTQVAKGYIAPIEKGAALSKVEESFASSIAEKIPFVRRSERAFVTYLNELRFASYKSARGAILGKGGGDKELEMLGRFINLASGRGDLPKSLDKFAPMLNTMLFSPRLQAATLELPVLIGKMFMSKNRAMQIEAAKALVTFAGGGAALLALLEGGGVAKVEKDPRSGDFGKLIIGETRLDIWRGYLQYIRFASQLLTEQKKSAYGNMSKKDRFETTFRFLQSKSSPAVGLLIDSLKGETYMGDPLFEGTTGSIKTARERLMPLALQDTIDAMEQSGINGLWTAAPAMLGIGTLTYINEYANIQNKIAKDAGFDSWDDIDPKTKRDIWNRSPELQAARIQLDRRVMDTSWGEWRSAGNAIEDNFKTNVELATNQYRQIGDGVGFRKKVADAFTERRGAYDARDKDERFEEITRRMNVEDTAQSMIELDPEQRAINIYNKALYSEDMYDEFGDYRWDEAETRKEQLKQSLGELYKYVEEYQAMKYDNFPDEYKELARAKIVMKPYWAIKDNIARMFGQTYADSNAGQRMITKLRQQIRMGNAEIERFYQLFYAQQ